MLPSLLPEAGGVAHILERQLALLKPLASVHGTQRLLAGGNEVLVLAVWACRQQDGLEQKEHVSKVKAHMTTYKCSLCSVR